MSFTAYPHPATVATRPEVILGISDLSDAAPVKRSTNTQNSGSSASLSLFMSIYRNA